jgi:methionine aminotransferase
VIIFDPAYDSYEPAVLLNGGIPVHVPLTFPGYEIDWDRLRSSVTPRTKLVIINSPNNPTGSVLRQSDIEILKSIITQGDIYLLSDEVYEHIVFDGAKHLSLILDDELYRRSFIVSSFGKTFHITGWKVGYCTAPETLTAEFRKIHQFLTFATSSPFQFALAEYIRDLSRIRSLSEFYSSKRDRFNSYFEGTGLKPLACSGTYFQIMDYSGISDLPDREFAEWLAREKKVACIPVSAFYKDRTDNKVVRFCFAKQDETLRKAAERLKP